MQPNRIRVNETIAVLGVTLLVVLAGCGGFAGTGDRASPSADAADEPRGPDSGTEWTVSVTRVIDGDTIEVAFPNGETDTVRLLGVDTPETTYDSVTPGEFGIPDTAAGRDHLHAWGQRATRYATETLAGETVRIETDPDADRRGGFGRLLAYVYLDGENVNERLLANGYARLYDTPFSLRDAFRETEREARAESVGLWGFEASTDSRPASTDSVVVTLSPYPSVASSVSPEPSVPRSDSSTYRVPSTPSKVTCVTSKLPSEPEYETVGVTTTESPTVGSSSETSMDDTNTCGGAAAPVAAKPSTSTRHTSMPISMPSNALRPRTVSIGVVIL